MRRLTFGGRNHFPIWSADGERIAFQSDREGDAAIFWQRADGTGAAERLTRPDKGVAHIPQAWDPAGEKFLFGRTGTGETVGSSLWTFSLRDRKAEPFGVRYSGTLRPPSAAFSPDGRWVAYSSFEIRKIYGLRAAVPCDRRQVSDRHRHLSTLSYVQGGASSSQ
jgi:Tol biopolymer transport system component